MNISYIVWNKEYSVDVPEIDLQHKELMNLVNNTIRQCSGNIINEKKYFNKLINESLKYLQKHFSTEEQIFEKTGYDKKDEHKNEHKMLLDSINRITDEMEDGNKEFDLLKITLNLKEWLLTHILAYDITAKKYFREGMVLNI